MDEEKLLPYAVITAMGLTYLWLYLHELQFLGQSCGMRHKEV